MEGSAPNWSLRPATEDDLPLILEIERKVHFAPWTLENFKGEMAKPYSQVLLITDDETDALIGGYIVYWLMFDECQILNVAVDLPYRGRGMAKRMVAQAVQAAMNKNINKILLDVRKSNEAAIELYQRMNFVITHVRKSFYSNGEDAYQMALFLNEEAGDSQF